MPILVPADVRDLLVRRYMVGPEAEGVFTLFAIAFFLLLSHLRRTQLAAEPSA